VNGELLMNIEWWVMDEQWMVGYWWTMKTR